MAVDIITSFVRQDDSNGDPMSGAKVYVYDVGTTTLRNVYSDTALSSAAANPIVCDSAGLHDMRYTATGSYKITVKTSADVTVYSRDNIDGRVPVGSGALAIANGGTGATNAAAAIAALGGSTAAEVADIAADVASLQGTLASTEKTHLATGTTAQRPGSPIEGDIRRNSQTLVWEFYNGSAYENVVLMPTGQTDPSATDTAEGLIELAVQTEMETATDVLRSVTPGRQHFHPGHPKMAGLVTVSAGTPTLNTDNDYNITSIADTATGRMTVTIATDFSGANWIASFTMEHGVTTATTNGISTGTRAAGTIEFYCFTVGGPLVDPVSWSFSGIGDL